MREMGGEYTFIEFNHMHASFLFVFQNTFAGGENGYGEGTSLTGQALLNWVFFIPEPLFPIHV